jgi:hypothetical protein
MVAACKLLACLHDDCFGQSLSAAQPLAIAAIWLVQCHVQGKQPSFNHSL